MISTLLKKLTILLVYLITLQQYGFAQRDFRVEYKNENHVIDFVELGNDTIITFTKGGYYKIHNKNEINKSAFSIENKFTIPAINVVHKQNDSIIWLGGDGTLFSLKNDQILQVDFPSDAKVESIAVSDMGVLWIGTWGDGLYRFDGESWSNYTQSSHGLSDNRVTALLFEQNRLWLGYHFGIGFFENESFTNIASDFFFNDPFDVKQLLKHNNALIIAAWGGLHIYQDGKLDQVVDDQSILSVTTDASDTLWFGTNDNGLFKIHVDDLVSNDYPFYPDIDPVPYQQVKDTILSVFTEKITIDRHGKKWLASSDGIFYHNGGWNMVAQKSLKYDRIQCFAFRDNEVWIGTYRGLSLHMNDQWYQFDQQELQNLIINDIFISHDGFLWISASNKLLKTEFDSVIKVLNIVESFDIGYVYKIDARDSVLFFGTWGQGVYKYQDNVFSQYKVENGLASNFVKDIKIQDDSVWVVTTVGISNITPEAITNFEAETDFEARYVNCVDIDEDGTSWFGCSGGLLTRKNDEFFFHQQQGNFLDLEIDGNDDMWLGNYFFKKQDSTFIALEEDGDLIIKSNRAIETDPSSGHLWFGNYDGIVVIDPSKMLPSETLDLNIQQPLICTDSVTVGTILNDNTSAYELKLIGNPEAKVEKTDDANYSIYDLGKNDLQISYRGINKYYDAGWSDTITFVLNFPPVETSIDTLFCEGDTIMFGGQSIFESGSYSFSFPNENSCDSIVTWEVLFESCLPDSSIIMPSETLNLNILQPINCRDSVIINAILNDSTSSFELNLIAHPEAIVEKIDNANYSIYDLVNSDFQISYRGVNEYNKSQWSDTINFSLNLPSIQEVIDTVFCDGDTIMFGGQSFFENGSYTSTFSNESGCDSTVIWEATFNDCITANKSDQGNSVSVHPNPVIKYANINFEQKGHEKKIRIKVRDLSGKLLQDEFVNMVKAKIDLSKLSSGIYILEIGTFPPSYFRIEKK